jgi:NAD+ kinase
MKFGIVGNLSKSELWKAVSDLLFRFHQQKVDYVIQDELAHTLVHHVPDCMIAGEAAVPIEDIPAHCDIIISFGGDGTILHTARLIGSRGTPIIGVNLGKLGFLAEFSVGDIPLLLDRILDEKFQIENRMVLTGKITDDNKISLFAMNDIVIDKGAFSRLIRIETYVDDEYLVTYSSDGLILSTPTGSTGYSLSAMGPIVVPSGQVIIINPITPHTLTARPVIVPDTSVIRAIIHSGAEHVHIAADGQVNAVYTPPVEVIVRKADFTIRLVKRAERRYFDVLRTKLMWGQDIRSTRKDS